MDLAWLHDALLTTLGLLLDTGLPLLWPALVVGLWLRAGANGRAHSKAFWALLLLCTGQWLLLLGEHHSGGRVALFDYGAPLASVALLPVLPVLLLIQWLNARAQPRAPEPTMEHLTHYLLKSYALISLLPGSYLAWYLAAMLTADR